MVYLKIACLLLLILILGCSSPVVSKSGMLQSNEYPRKEYRIQPGDILDIKFFYNPELNEQLTVRSDGKITLQLIDEVVAAGFTPAELANTLVKVYSKELVNPQIAVIIRTSVADKIYVDGEVNRAGLITLTGPMTAVQCVSQAGGMKESANADVIVVIRREENDTISKIIVNVAKVRKGAENEDLFLKPNDFVFVPKSSISNINSWINLYIKNNVPLPIGLGYSIR